MAFPCPIADFCLPIWNFAGMGRVKWEFQRLMVMLGGNSDGAIRILILIITRVYKQLVLMEFLQHFLFEKKNHLNMNFRLL